MRRPLCVMALLFTVALRILLEFAPAYDDPYLELDGERVVLIGRIVSEEYKSGMNSWTGEETLTLLISMDHVAMEGADCASTDKVLVRVPVETGDDDTCTTLPIGAWIRVRGTLAVFEPATVSGAFDALLYYRTLGYIFQVRNASVEASAGLGSPLSNTLYRIRTRLGNVLYDVCVSEEDADILAAMLLGDKGGLSQEIRDLYQSAGIIHILAISGLHIQIIGMGCYRLLHRGRMPQLLCAALSAGMMLLYGQMTGVSASSYRALVMFLLHIAARTMHRTYDLLSALSIAGLLLLIDQPLYLYNSGFLFSFGAVLAIGLLTPLLPADILGAGSKSRLWRWNEYLRERIRGESRSTVMTPLPGISLQGLAATIGTFPVNLCTYGTFPLYSVALNALVLPLMSLVMVLGLMLLGGGMMLRILGVLPALPVHYLLHFYRLLCQIAADLPGHIQVIGHPETWTLIAFLCLMGGLLIMAGNRHRLPGIVILLWITACLQLLTWHGNAGLAIHVIDVGQGDGLYIECDGRRLLIDGGSTDQSDVARYRLEPLLTWYGADRIDLAIMTHEDEDHMSGLLTLLQSQEETGIRILRIALPDIVEAAKGDNYRAVELAAIESGTDICYLHQGSEIQIGELNMVCLNPAAGMTVTEPNETSVTLYLTYGAFTALLTGDLEGEGETECVAYMESRKDLFPNAADGNPATYDTVTFLKTAHHGSRGATTEAFLAAVHPQYAAISCGRDNRYGHPHEETLDRLAAAGSQILDTRYAGEITVTTNGHSMQIRTFLQQ